MGVDAEMYVKTSQPLEELEVCELSYRLSEAFGPHNFFIWKDTNRHALSISDRNYYNIPLEPHEQLIEVNISGRYYGKGYERGSIHLYIAIAQWLEFNIPTAHIYYGGDCGEGLDPFPKQERDRLFKHFATHGGIPYRSGFTENKYHRHCDFCHHDMQQFGSGRDYASFSCLGCGRTDTTNDSGKTWEVKDG